MSSECPTCGECFETDHGMKIHHEAMHDKSLAQIECTCETCGESFTEFESRINNGRGRFCSTECKHNIGRIEVTCCHCGETVKKAKHRTGRYERSFCSRECNRKWLSIEGNAPGWNQQRENHSQWAGGTRTWYGTNWEEQREKAIERDGYQCLSCGMTRDDHREVYGRDLTVHHLTPIREFRSDGELDYEAANSLDNLMTVCRGCHKQWDLLPIQPEVA